MGQLVTPYKGREVEPIISAALKMYDEGTEIAEAAEELGVPARTIHRWLATNAQDAWKEAQQARAMADYELARKARDTAKNALFALEEDLTPDSRTTMSEGEARSMNWRLAHVREVLRAADTELDHQKWLLERLLRRLYGQEQAVTHSQVIIQLGSGFLAPQQKHDISTEDAQVIDVAPNPADRQSVGGSAEVVGGVEK